MSYFEQSDFTKLEANQRSNALCERYSGVRACRACLATGKPLHNLHDSDLGDVFAVFGDLTGFPVVLTDSYPQLICSMCLYVLRKFLVFKTRCQSVMHTLQQMEINNDKITTDLLTKTEHKYTYNLSKTKIEIISIDNKLPPTSIQEIKEEKDLPNEEYINEGHKDVENLTFQYEFIKDEVHTDDSDVDVCENAENVHVKNLVKGHDQIKDVINKDANESSHASNKSPVNTKSKKYKQLRLINGRKLRSSSSSLSKRNISKETTRNEKVEKSEIIMSKQTAAMAYSCDICHYATNDENMLDSHLKAHACSVKYFCESCPYCPYITVSKTKLIQHLQTHPLSKSCNDIDEKSKQTHPKNSKTNFNEKLHLVPQERKVTLDRHQKKGGNKTYTCDLCQKKFARRDNLIDHLSIHTTGEKLHSCDICHKNFSTKRLLSRHQKRNHIIDKTYFCYSCPKKFAYTGDLFHHQKIYHSNDKAHTCNTCLEKFNTKYELVTHSKTHIRDKGNNKITCNVCNKNFAMKYSLVLHQRTHTGEKPYTCNECHKNFAQKIALIRHLRNHTGEKPFTCGICHESFSNKVSLVSHSKKYHPSITQKELNTNLNTQSQEIIKTKQSLSDEKLCCNVCRKKFTRTNLLTKHYTRCHKFVKPYYSCDICQATFRLVTSMVRHMRIHSCIQIVPTYTIHE